MNTSLLAVTALSISLSAYSFVPHFHSHNAGHLHKSQAKTYSTVKLETLKIKNLEKNKSSNKILAELRTEALAQKKDGVIRVKQKYQGVTIYGAELVFDVKDGNILSSNGRVVMNYPETMMPLVSKKMSLAIAFNERKSKYNSSLIILPIKGASKLVWHVTEDHFASLMNYFIDAQTGEILDAYNALSMGAGAGHDGITVNVDSTQDLTGNNYVLDTPSRTTYNAHNRGEIVQNPWTGQWQIRGLPGDIATSADDNWTDPAEVDAHNYAGAFLEVLQDKFNRNSFDGNGRKVVSTVHFMRDYVNAFWNGRQMVYGDGDGVNASNLAGSFDVVAHEISHAITTSTNGLVYRNEPGALNESFSDIIATYAESVAQPNKFDWIMGEDVWTPGIPGDGLRYMNNPNRDRNPNPRPGREWAYSRDHYTDLYRGQEDNGGVHINSGISNLAFYLLSEGGTHPTQAGASVTGIGIEAAAQIVFKAFTTKLTSQSDFSDARSAMIEVAQDNYDQATVDSVIAAWDAVGVQ